MSLDTQSYSPPVKVDHGSDVADLNLSSSGELIVRIACRRRADGEVDGLQVSFPRVSEFRLLDEVTLATWWMSPGFKAGHHVLEVVGGGWGSELNNLQGYEVLRREWLLVTGNGCMSVISNEPPRLQDIVLPEDI